MDNFELLRKIETKTKDAVSTYEKKKIEKTVFGLWNSNDHTRLGLRLLAIQLLIKTYE